MLEDLVVPVEVVATSGSALVELLGATPSKEGVS